MQDQRRKYTETPGGEKASARPRSALARGGSPATPGKRSVFPKRVNAPTIISDYFAVYRFCVKNHSFRKILYYEVVFKRKVFCTSSIKSVRANEILIP